MTEQQAHDALANCLSKYYPDIKVNIYDFNEDQCSADLVSMSFFDNWTTHLHKINEYLSEDAPELFFSKILILLPVTPEMYMKRIAL